MDYDDVSFDSIAGSEDDELDPQQANDLQDAIYSAGDPDDASRTEDVDDENDDQTNK